MAVELKYRPCHPELHSKRQRFWKSLDVNDSRFDAERQPTTRIILRSNTKETKRLTGEF